MKKQLLTLVLAFSSGISFAQYSGGDGSSLDPYQIANQADLLFLSTDTISWDRDFIQTADIVFDPADFQIGGIAYNNGDGFGPIGSYLYNFRGTYDGNNYKISNLSSTRQTGSGYRPTGLFGFVSTDAIVSNINLDNITSISLSSDAGGIATSNEGQIKNCRVTGNITALFNAGGICAYMYGYSGQPYTGRIENCTDSVTVTSTTSSGSYTGAGGICGYLDGNGTILNCTSKGTVTSNAAAAGGICGDFLSSLLIDSCYSFVNVTGVDYVGGICGKINYSSSNVYSTIKNCQASGKVSGRDYVGGAFGSCDYASVKKVIAAINIIAFEGDTINGRNYVGGLCGYAGENYPVKFDSCYSNCVINATGGTKIGGLIGYSYSCKINSSWSGSTIYHGSEVGGLIGYSKNDTLINANSYIIYIDSTSSSIIIGGLIGSGELDYITKCYSAGGIYGYDRIGGFIANDDKSKIQNSYSEVDMIAVMGAAGFIGDGNNSMILNCYSIGDAESDAAGVSGFILGGSGTITNCYSAGTITTGNGLSPVMYGFSGALPFNCTMNHCFFDTLRSTYYSIGSGAYGTSSNAMKIQKLYTDSLWDFVGETTNGTDDVWKMGQCNNDGYPVFSWQTAKPYPTITSTTGASICDSGAVTISAVNSDVDGAIVWYASNISSSLLDVGNNFLTPVLKADTSYWALATCMGGNNGNRTKVSINVYQTPDTTVAVSGNILTANASGTGITYQWINCSNNTTIGGATAKTYTATANGNYAVIVGNGNCSDTSACNNITTVGISPLSLANAQVLSIYPNPSNGIYTIENLQTGSTIKVIDVLGNEVYISIVSTSKSQLDLSSLNNGIYFLTSNKQGYIKLIKTTN